MTPEAVVYPPSECGLVSNAVANGIFCEVNRVAIPDVLHGEPVLDAVVKLNQYFPSDGRLLGSASTVLARDISVCLGDGPIVSSVVDDLADDLELPAL